MINYKRLAIPRELILKINCCITHAFISDDKIFIQGQVLINVQKLCES